MNTAKKQNIKVETNNNFKRETFSLSAYCRFAQSETGAKVLQPYLDSLNNEFSTNLSLNQITTKLIASNLTAKQKTIFVIENGEKVAKAKQIFSFWLILTAIKNHCKSKAK
jgi:hypothetical protein